MSDKFDGRWGFRQIATLTSSGNIKEVEPTEVGFDEEELDALHNCDMDRADVKEQLRDVMEDDESEYDYGDLRIVHDIGPVEPSRERKLEMLAEQTDTDLDDVI